MSEPCLRRIDDLSTGEDAESMPSQFAYLDLLATTLTEHEKNLDRHLRRLEKMMRNLSKVAREARSREPAIVERVAREEETPETLVYMKLKVNRPTEELALILNSLKE